ncbi:unnamed protein product [Boreogadus saida]
MMDRHKASFELQLGLLPRTVMMPGCCRGNPPHSGSSCAHSETTSYSADPRQPPRAAFQPADAGWHLHLIRCGDWIHGVAREVFVKCCWSYYHRLTLLTISLERTENKTLNSEPPRVGEAEVGASRQVRVAELWNSP